MMGWSWFPRRRSRGRHALGAAVTSIPSAPLHLAVPVPVDLGRASCTQVLPGSPPHAAPLEAVRRSAPTVTPLPSLPAVPASRVQLGFRDGSTASLAAGSEQAVALEALAGLLNRRSS